MLFAKGLALERQGKYDEALISYTGLINIDKKNAEARNAKGLILQRQGKKDEAQKCFDEAKEINHNKYISLTEEGNHSLLIMNTRKLWNYSIRL